VFRGTLAACILTALPLYRRGNSRQPVSAEPVDTTALAMQAMQASQWELDPDKLLIGDRIAVGGCAEVRCALFCTRSHVLGCQRAPAQYIHVATISSASVCVQLQVFVGKLDGTVVAIKLLLNVDAGVLERFFQEVSILAALRHPNLLLFMGYTRSPALAMVSE
jgi:hypothetical protein